MISRWSERLKTASTYMGNTLVQYWCNEVYKDHPHIHGEYLLKYWRKTTVPGSPPHTWGIQTRKLAEYLWGRITPTYMGNTLWMTNHFIKAKDHPHIHGEYKIVKEGLVGYGGSPPHTWGILISIISIYPYLRITPTYMGNTYIVLRAAHTFLDHPHIHGEYCHPTSPHHTSYRITPTYMGNTSPFKLKLMSI